ncbi:RloB family protein [Mucilaginibacter daejeonensis]|uniref:RloB family protein n=1 Tax=Mucilaginibacter daejeonensis TaxID=398049 RepID=UPI001D17971E|nr:RloB family protein [Mucilaginibacter daejeonensis]UEG51841.1 RloB family protein [Mucilaginibacter daejeonensis]
MRFKVNKRILILCEGVTEYLYAKTLQSELPRTLQQSISVEVFYSTKNDPKQLVNEAHRRLKAAVKERNPYDTVWLFFDKDQWPDLESTFRQIERDNFEVAYSSIAIEHWFILHFEHRGRAFQTGEEALRHLTRLWPEYHKTKLNHYKHLKERLALAMERAKMINRQQDGETPIHVRNPFFTVQRLVDFFENLKEEGT